MALVLLVDDDVTILEMLSDVVIDAGHEVLTAKNGAEALAQALASPPALIITDVMMPVLDGYGLLRAVRETPALQHTLIFLMSAAFSAQRSPTAQPEPDGYVAKPFNLAVIEGLLRQLPSGA